MRTFRLSLFLLSLLTVGSVQAQKRSIRDSLTRAVAQAKTPTEKAERLMHLAEDYAYRSVRQSDSLGQLALDFADESRDRRLIARMMLRNLQRRTTLPTGTVQLGPAQYQPILKFIRENQLNDLLPSAYTVASRLHVYRAELSKSLELGNRALEEANGLGADTLRYRAMNWLAYVHLSREEKVQAFRLYSRALQLAEQIGRDDLLRSAYNALAGTYAQMENLERAKDYAVKAIEVDRRVGKPAELAQSISYLGQLYAANKQYALAEKKFREALALAEGTGDETRALQEKSNLGNLYFRQSAWRRGLDYFEKEHPELLETYRDNGIEWQLYPSLGYIHSMLDEFDQAQELFVQARPGILASGGPASQAAYYQYYGEHLKRMKRAPEAIASYRSALTKYQQMGTLSAVKDAAANLDTLYRQTGNYQQAYTYQALRESTADSLQKLSEAKEILQVEIDNEAKAQELARQREEAETQRRHQLQYMGISVGIVTLFVLLVMAGVFRVSVRTIRALGFFAFILLFEFIIYLADVQIHHLTHGEPIKILGIKVALIALLLPFHHWLEHRVIHYLTSHHLVETRERWMKRLFRRRVGEAKGEVV
jgi:tetratricopeptide (TPR) repeat protein